MPDRTETFAGGFANAVFDSQAVFRTLMDCMARPGQTGEVTLSLAPPAPLGIAAGAVMLTLCDHDTPVWLSPKLSQSPVPGWLAFHGGAPLTTERHEARFAFFEGRAPLPSLGAFALGSQEYPDRSTTLIIEVASLDNGQPLTLSGPGIRDTAGIAPNGLPADFLRQWSGNGALFPRGVDVVLTAGRRLVALPRTCKITAKTLTESVAETPASEG
ncbi:phosphonate C-P lyase system protein PhnH [Rhizobium sp. CSW-27]|uniref:phosphonate C-P lyase system protein PhnH n=1 Tax=Rhizobium sp. CSW-27 TaxID=2839985 RepID=UPI001C02C117|nr:phosphonate C-P lyase system protein PhnH [Rhizobium sp. CSW-27]MBT9371649.1 phosphonate C-P lyase system protein PhnH [Rhizobium sp. CSW-27]